MSDTITREVLKEELAEVRQDFKEEMSTLTVKLFQHIDKRFDELNQRMDAVDEKYDRLMTTLDAFLKRLDDIEKDNYARDAQLARLERWIEQVARKSGVKLEY